MKKSLRRKKKKASRICFICWVILPSVIVTALILDGLEIYSFNVERLIVLGVCILVMLLPFFKEITIKNISIKKENNLK